tara:strand:+ start:281 stop:496 length:216 start_codon:yes stop_codon:yes gene_type:complete
MDIIAAKSDNLIVAENPEIKNLILAKPDLVVGSITYQPQFPEAEEQLTNIKEIINARMIFFFIRAIQFFKI